jgi:large subunit ribosomal protein L18
MDKNSAKWSAIATKKLRIRKNVLGTADRPRLSVYRSEKHIYGQVIDDIKGHTLVAASTLNEELAKSTEKLSPLDAAKAVGEALASKCLAAGVTKVVFDRNGRIYGGRLAALADAARAKGLQF